VAWGACAGRSCWRSARLFRAAGDRHDHGLSAFIIAIGQVGGPMIAGALADLTGNYRAGFTVLALIAGSGSLLFLLARKPQPGAAGPAPGVATPAQP